MFNYPAKGSRAMSMNWTAPFSSYSNLANVTINPHPENIPDGFRPWDGFQAGDVICFDEARDGTVICLLRRTGSIVSAFATDEPFRRAH